jgi:hypothetical protein
VDIEIFATLLIPVISAMRGRAQRVQCTSNLRNLYITAALSIVSALSAVSVSAQNPAPEQGPKNCYLEVKNVLSGLEIQRNWETDWGSYDRDHFGRIILNIRLGTVGRTGGPMKIQWFFIGRKLSDLQRLIVYGTGEKGVMVPAGYFTECYAASPVLKNSALNLAAIGERYVSGAQHDGWIVCATDGRDRRLAEKASSESLLNLFHDAAQFSKLLSSR